MASDESGAETASRARAPFLAARTRLARARGAWRRARALENFDLAAIVLLCALAVGGSAWGWALRPPAGAPVQILTPLRLSLNFTGTRPRGLQLYSQLTQERGAGTQLLINAFGYAVPGPRAAPWNLGVQGFTGHFCTPKAYRSEGRPIRVGGPDSHDYVDSGTVHLQAAASAGIFLVVHLCWRNDPLLTLTSSYFSAALPLVLVHGAAGTLTDILQLRGTSLSGYSPSGGPAPTGFGPQTWSWSTPLTGNLGTQASSELPVFGASTAQIQRDNHNTFYSGILFGIAASAALSLIPALAFSIDRRRKRPPAPASPGAAPS